MRDLRDSLQAQLRAADGHPPSKAFFRRTPLEINNISNEIEAFEVSLAMWYIKASLELMSVTVLDYMSDLSWPPDDRTTCGLCRYYYRGHACGDCPVRLTTGQDFCEGTPYSLWSDAEDPSDAAEAAWAEYGFLLKLASEFCPDYDWVDWSKESECVDKQ